MADKESRTSVREALDLNPLAVLPSDLINQLGWKQEEWLAARLLTYSDRQACLNLGIHLATLRKWREKHPAFEACYNVIVLDRINTKLVLDRILQFRVALKQLELLDSRSLKVQLEVMKQVNASTNALAAAQAKQGDTKTQINFFGDKSPNEWMRQALEAGVIGDPYPDRTLDLSGTGSIGLLDSPEASGESGPLYQYSGRDDFELTALDPVALADSLAQPNDDGEIPDHSQGPAAGSELDGLPPSGLAGDLLPQ